MGNANSCKFNIINGFRFGKRRRSCVGRPGSKEFEQRPSWNLSEGFSNDHGGGLMRSVRSVHNYGPPPLLSGFVMMRKLEDFGLIRRVRAGSRFGNSANTDAILASGQANGLAIRPLPPWTLLAANIFGRAVSDLPVNLEPHLHLARRIGGRDLAKSVGVEVIIARAEDDAVE